MFAEYGIRRAFRIKRGLRRAAVMREHNGQLKRYCCFISPSKSFAEIAHLRMILDFADNFAIFRVL